MSPDGSGHPTGPLAELIDRDFGGYGAFRREFIATAKGIEGSGWAVLGLKKGMRGKRLEIAPVHNHENRALWQFQVLLPMDVWEHAYYLDQNDREGWANTFLDHLVDWEYVGTRL
jgi:Fe-Mn family superoxide dismutase